jgi:hypothetical protein
MADEKLYRYVANRDPYSTVEVVTLSEDGEKVARLGEGPVWLTEAQAAGAAGSVVLEEVGEDEEGAPPKSGRPPEEAEDDLDTNTDGTPEAPEGNQAGGVVDPRSGAGTSSGARRSSGQGSRGASGQDVGTTTGGVG